MPYLQNINMYLISNSGYNKNNIKDTTLKSYNMRKNRNKYLISTLALSLWCASFLFAQKIEVHQFDVSKVAKIDNSAPHLAKWTQTNPKGVTIAANLASLTIDGKPMPVASGEFHPQRFPVEYWEEAILEMKAGGLNVIGCYWFWGFIEPKPGKFDFSGSNNVRLFTELCKKHDMLVFERIGPFCNAEIMNGGLPSWLFGMPLTERSNDPAYLERVQLYYNEMGKQMKGLYWKDGGPIHMVQLENELLNAPVMWKMVYRYGAAEEHRGPTEKDDWVQHYVNLRQIALKAEIDPAFFCLTGWKALGIPENQYVVAFGGYMYLGQQKNNSGLTCIIGSNLHNINDLPYPATFIELGAAGSPARIEWLPQPPAESALSTAISKIGAYRSISCGWYMYHGGTNPLHPIWGFSAKYEELSLLSYDYHAPIGEFGVLRPAYYQLRPFHQTLLNFSEMFADGKVVLDNPLVKPGEDKLRASVRMEDDKSGVVFLLHYANIDPLSNRKSAIEINTKDGMIRIPSEGTLDLTNGDFAVLPFNQPMGDGVKLVSSSAQLCSKVVSKNETVIFCQTMHDQPAELVLNLPKGSSLKTSGKKKLKGGNTIVDILPAMDANITIELPGNKKLVFVVLPLEAVRHSVEAKIDGQKTYLISDQDIVVDLNKVRLTSMQPGKYELLSYPSISWKSGTPEKKVGLFSKISTQVQPVSITSELDSVTNQKWLIKIDKSQFNNLNDIYIDTEYDGLLCRVFDQITGLPVTDQFNDKGYVWTIGMKRFRNALAGPGLVFYATGNDGQAIQETSKDGMLLDEKQQGNTKGKMRSMTFKPEYKVWFEAY